MSILGNWKVILEHREKIGQTHSKGGRRKRNKLPCVFPRNFVDGGPTANRWLIMLSFGVQEMWARLHWFSFHYPCLPRGRIQERDSGILGSFVLDFVKGLQKHCDCFM